LCHWSETNFSQQFEYIPRHIIIVPCSRHYYLISRGGDVPWPARSPDLAACGYILLGCLKSNLFTSQPRTIEKLKQRIKEEITAIPEQVTRRVMEKLRERLEQCLRNCGGGGHLRDEIFKNKMAYTEFIADNNCYIIRWNVTVLLRFENRQGFLPPSVWNFMIIRPGGVELFHTYGQTDRYDEANSSFLNFAKAFEKYFSWCVCDEICYISVLNFVHPRAGKYLRLEINWSRTYFLSYASMIQRNFHQESTGLLEHATADLTLVLPLTAVHWCGVKIALTKTLFKLFPTPCRHTR
jgi:hypothetical protein